YEGHCSHNQSKNRSMQTKATPKKSRRQLIQHLTKTNRISRLKTNTTSEDEAPKTNHRTSRWIPNPS
ncbi:hypothetical protein RA276_31790, partial [Pseudomonas syringae pv. tagetis]|uniref:hypothetical protein n=1 Tax=Pseudomonas syringae group genomosp. 7 TaxID=251699 RepID=UPI0037704993